LRDAAQVLLHRRRKHFPQGKPMQISSSTLYPFQTQQKPAAISPLPSTSSSSASQSALANGIGTYDFTNMTPNQMQAASQALAASGKISSTDAIRMQLFGMPLGKLVDGKFQPLTQAERDSYANTPVNYMQLFQSNMAFLQQNGMASDPKAGYASDQAILSAMQGAQGTVSSVNITA
jgi:hypothetical protein